MILNKRNPETLETISSLIGDGGVAILPCDTVYGLCAAYDIGEKALRDLKGRDSRKPFLVLATIVQAKQLCTEIPQDILEAWPAALTVILNRKEGGTIAIRVPNDAFLQELLEMTGTPIYSTSVNIAGEPSLHSLSAICKRFESLVDVVVRGDEMQGKVPSTLIDATVKPYKLVRQGLYDASELIRG